MRLIKKYPNRRLYDTERSRYITLDDVRGLVLEGEEFRVEDTRSGEDVTRGILLQLILEQEGRAGEGLFTNDVLRELIRFYGGDLQGPFARFLDKTCRVMVEQQHAYQRDLQAFLRGDPFAFMRGATTRNLNLWRELQDAFSALTGAVQPPGGSPSEGSEPSDAGSGGPASGSDDPAG